MAGILIPLGIKIYKQIKRAKEDGVVTKEEVKEILETTTELAKKTESLVKEVSESKSEGDKE